MQTAEAIEDLKLTTLIPFCVFFIFINNEITVTYCSVMQSTISSSMNPVRLV